MPNPAHDGVTLDLGGPPTTDMRYRLLDANGKLLAYGAVTATSTFIPFAGLPAAIYLFHLLRGKDGPLVLQVIKH